MPLICYIPKRFQGSSQQIIDQANEIIEEYANAGYDLTLRQLYYQFVARDLLANNQKNYKRLGSIINDARLAGLIDWERIEDRTRGIETLSSWNNPAEIVQAVSEQFRVDMWHGQSCRVEVWIEKEALAGVFQRVCEELRIPYLSCRGYTSQSEMWRAGRRLSRFINRGQMPVILHFGDHDPSGIDMSRDIIDRLRLFLSKDRLDFKRLALNMDQIVEHNPPPNPAKATDIRFNSYVDKYGKESWELDALDPAILSEMVRTEVNKLIDKKQWKAQQAKEQEGRRLLGVVADQWGSLTEGL